MRNRRKNWGVKRIGAVVALEKFGLKPLDVSFLMKRDGMIDTAPALITVVFGEIRFNLVIRNSKDLRHAQTCNWITSDKNWKQTHL